MAVVIGVIARIERCASGGALARGESSTWTTALRQKLGKLRAAARRWATAAPGWRSCSSTRMFQKFLNASKVGVEARGCARERSEEDAWQDWSRT
jgi:hypothetical protein